MANIVSLECKGAYPLHPLNDKEPITVAIGDDLTETRVGCRLIAKRIVDGELICCATNPIVADLMRLTVEQVQNLALRRCIHQ